jgi:FkbM family methyltransferase
MRLTTLLASRAGDRAFPVGQQAVVYGAGNTGALVHRLLRRRGVPVRCFIDRRGGPAAELGGVPVYAPGTEPLDTDARRDAVAFVAVFNRDADVAAIHALLEAAGYGRVVGFVELHNLFAGALPDMYWLTSRNFYASRSEEIRAGAARWRDAESRALYESVLSYRLTGDVSFAPHPGPGPQYFPVDVPRPAGPVRFVDCGAYTGDSVRVAAAQRDRLEVVCAFEPDPANFAELARRASAEAPHAQVYLWPCGVAGETRQMRFSATGGETGHLSESGETVVQCVALDEALAWFDATDVKMDVEGAEPDALAGARALIGRSRPRLAVCVYHRPDHLWSIAAAIDEMDLDYDLYLRAHGYGGFDLVAYAVPRDGSTPLPSQGRA